MITDVSVFKTSANRNKANQIDLVPLQSKFFPAKNFLCFWKREFWWEKNYFSKD
jgi:hypothetical protein